jgi:dUTPase
VCGWTRDNEELHVNIVNSLNCDIISICETHLPISVELAVQGYSWIGFNRTSIHVNAPKPSGGVGLLIKQWIFDVYTVSLIDRSYDGILGVKFLNSATDHDFIVYSQKIPQEGAMPRDSSHIC